MVWSISLSQFYNFIIDLLNKAENIVFKCELFQVGGTETEYNAVKGLLECMGQRITHCGDYGMGQAAKLCNNMMLGISMIGTCETMNLAVRYVAHKTICL